MELNTTVRNYRLVIGIGQKEREILVTKQVAREAICFKNRQKSRYVLDDHKNPLDYRSLSFFDIQGPDGNYSESIDRTELKFVRGPKVADFNGGTETGFYCEWGTYHVVAPFIDPCTCLRETKVPWMDMKKARETFYPKETRPDGCPERALRVKERETLVAYCHEYYAKNLPVPNPPLQ